MVNDSDKSKVFCQNDFHVGGIQLQDMRFRLGPCLTLLYVQSLALQRSVLWNKNYLFPTLGVETIYDSSLVAS